MPNKTQIDSNRDVSIFSPVLGGYYANGEIIDESTYGGWWGNEAESGAIRYRLGYNGDKMSTNRGSRDYGRYIRCVQKS